MAQRAEAQDARWRKECKQEEKQSVGPGLDGLKRSMFGETGKRGELLTRGRDDDGGRKGGWGWSLVLIDCGRSLASGRTMRGCLLQRFRIVMVVVGTVTWSAVWQKRLVDGG